MDNTTSWPKGWSESESDLKKDVIKKDRLCIISATILEASEALYQCLISLTVSISDTWRVTNDDYEDCLLGLWDSCAKIDTGNLLLHQCIITQHLHLV